MAGAVAALGEEAVLGVFEVEDLFSFDMGFEDAGVDGEGVAGEEDEVGLLAGFEGADGFVEVEYLGTGEGECFEGFFAGHAGAHADGGIAEKPAGVVDGVIGVEGGEDAALFELGSIAPFEVAGFKFSAGGVEEDEGAGDVGSCDFIGDFPSFGGVVEDDFKSELFF